MIIKNTDTNWFLMIFTILLLCSSWGFCAEPADMTPNKKVSLDNIGFISPIPKHLSERFPMCDAFLDVKWINREHMVGYSQYEVITKEKERKVMWGLIWLNEKRPIFGMDVYQDKRKGKLEELFNFIKNGEISFDNSLGYMKVKNGKLTRYFGPSGRAYTLSDERQMVCVPYPDEKRMWIVEGRTIKSSLDEQEKEAFRKIILLLLQGDVNDSWVESLYLVDINNDGKIDLTRRRTFIYSYNNTYHHAKRVSTMPDRSIWLFPPSTEEHTIFGGHESGYEIFLTTDGDSYFISNKLNITDITTSN